MTHRATAYLRDAQQSINQRHAPSAIANLNAIAADYLGITASVEAAKHAINQGDWSAASHNIEVARSSLQ